MGKQERGRRDALFLAAAKRRAQRKMHIRWDPSSLDLDHVSVSAHSPVLDGGAMKMN